jgi:hypothetical protein
LLLVVLPWYYYGEVLACFWRNTLRPVVLLKGQSLK